ncbi:ADP-ribosyltransferase [Amycolatopsis sp. NPDC006131]|uniref:ADP-ribosyltransferase n=1 Tax=Amycolatopsis sp. NPDC006131 TaxID=3156731 RepID=UPI0033B8BB46
MTTTLAALRSWEDLDWGQLLNWDPAKHPRDRRGRFTKSRTQPITEAERALVNNTLANFKPKRFDSDQAAQDYLNSQPKLTKAQADAVDRYTGDAFLDINRALRSGSKDGGGEQTTIDNLRAAMRPTKDDLILTRTVGMEAFGSVPLEDLVGKKVTDAGFSSTALGLAYGGGLGSVTMKIAVPKGTPAVFAAPYSRNPAEREIVLPDGLQMVVAQVKKNDKFGYDMTLVVLPKQSEPEPEPPAASARHRHVIQSQDFPTPPEDWPERDEDAVDAVDLGPVQAAWETALAALLELWRGSVVAAWIDQLLEQIRAVLRGEGAFTSLTVETDTAASHLADAMRELAETAAGHAVDEAAEHDVTLTAAWPTESELQDAAQTIATFEGQRYAQSAGREAARIAWPDADPDEITDHVRAHLEGLSDSTSAQALGGALTHAQNQARQTTFKSGPVGALYASEQMDKNTCDPCREIHGRWVANTDNLAPLLKLYPFGGYIDCKGTWRCRGTVVGVWRPKTTEGGS